jgi:succinate-acetate transporter protein
MMFGAIWVATAVGQLAAPPGARSAVLGIVLLAAAVMLLGIGAAAVLTRPLRFVLSMLAVARYALTGTYQLTGVTGVERASGWLGVPIALVALYGGIALLLEDTAGRTVLPTGRRNEASTAVRGELGDQVERIAQEAGVRRTL